MDIKQFVRIKLHNEDIKGLELAKELADEIDLPAPAISPDPVPFFLAYNGDRLELSENKDNTTSISIDFLTGAVRYRFHNDRDINQPLAKAVGIKKGFRPFICDATAGFGTDAFVLASLGCKVTMIERSPVVWALLQDGLRRAAKDTLIGELVTKNLVLYRGNAINILLESATIFDTVFIDPMFPATQKSALNKRKMRVLRSIVGDDEDQINLLESAFACARRRVAVKRQAAAPFIGSRSISYQVKGRSNRYDIYLVPHL